MEELINVDNFVKNIINSIKIEDTHPNKMNYSKKILKRFWSKVIIPDNVKDECWIWRTGKSKFGY